MLNFAMGILSVADRLKVGGMTALLGILAVFLLLAVLIVFIELFKLIFTGRNKATPPPVIPTAQIPESKATAVAAESDDAELVAAIMAAVSLCLESENNYNPDAEYVIRSIRRVRR